MAETRTLIVDVNRELTVTLDVGQDMSVAVRWDPKRKRYDAVLREVTDAVARAEERLERVRAIQTALKIQGPSTGETP